MNKKNLTLSGLVLLGINGLVLASVTHSRWIVHPIVDSEYGFLLGSSRHGRWVDAAHTARGLHRGTTYHVYGPGRYLGLARGSRPESAGAPCEDTSVIHLKPEAGSQTASSGAIAIAAPWKVFPRPVHAESTGQQVYIQAVSAVLAAHGIVGVPVHIDQVFRADLDGDGVDEVLISASNYLISNGVPRPSNRAGDYAFVLLRKVVRGHMVTSLVDGEFYPKANSFSAPNDCKIGAIMDLNGDGKMEVVIRNHYYEGNSVAVYQLRRSLLKPVLSTGCGA